MTTVMLAIGLIFLHVLVLWGAWNGVMPHLGLPEISLWQASLLQLVAATLQGKLIRVKLKGGL